MTPALFLLIVVGLILAPGFTITLSGLLVHHGIWSVEWAVPTLFVGVVLRYFTYETTRGGRRRSTLRAVVLLPYTIALLLVGLYVTHAIHEGLRPLMRLSMGVLGVAVGFIWVSRIWQRLPAKVLPWFRRLPDPERVPRGMRRQLAAFLVIPFWAAYPAELEAALSLAFQEVGLEPDLGSMRVSGERAKGLRATLGAKRVLLVAHKPGFPNDIYLVRVMFDHEGRMSHVTGIFNLSETASVDEDDLELEGRWATWKIRTAAGTQSIEVADLGGEKVPTGPGWSLLGRTQRRITNLQEVGQFRGVGRTSIPLGDSWSSVRTKLERGSLLLELGPERFAWELGREAGQSFSDAGLAIRGYEPARPGSLATWGVDRLRQIPFIGSNGMQWLKGVAFLAAGELEDLHARVVGVDAEEAISEELGEVVERLPIARTSNIPSWPPAPIKPLLSPALPSEGEWVDLGRDVLSGGELAGAGAMVFTFIRVDPKRTYNQVSVALWDARRIELHVVAGTEEPRSTLGQQGSGLVPRDPATLTRLVGAFNGAFQAVHGEFGMMEGKVVQLPPKPYAATVATFDDGSVGFGTWPAEPTAIPRDMVGLRQNMTPLVADARANPYARHWWGGVPEGWSQETRTVRSGLCLTSQHHVAYFYSPSIDPERLATAMQMVGCTYGIHLDMNGGHAGFELYRVERAGLLPSLGRPLDPVWEATGKVPGAEGYSFLARLLVKKMPLMNFPRYILETPRDFFYLTKRELLPGRNVILGDSICEFLPFAAAHNEYPYFAVATTLPAGAGLGREVQVHRLDAKQLALAGAEEAQAVWFRGGARAPSEDPSQAVAKKRLWFSKKSFRIALTASAESALLMEEADVPSEATDLYCLDASGFLNVVELEGRVEAAAVEPVTHALGCVESLRAKQQDRPRLDAGAPSAEGVRLYRRPPQSARQIFRETPMVLPSVWAVPQARRVNYEP